MPNIDVEQISRGLPLKMKGIGVVAYAGLCLVNSDRIYERMKIDYRTYFGIWKNWEEFEPRIDGISGVYAFRIKDHFGRLKGKSNILYIGKVEQNPESNKRPGIWHRLMNYRQNSKGASKRLKDTETCFGGRSSIEYAYEICVNPRDVEKELLKSYYERHLEFPPLNRSS